MSLRNHPWEAEVSPLDPVGKVSLSNMNQAGDSDLPAWATKSPKYCTPTNKKVRSVFPEMKMHGIAATCCQQA